MVSRKIKIDSYKPVSSQPFHELLAVADTVAREKGIEKEEAIVAMEQAIQKAAKAKYGLENDIRAEIDRVTGSVMLYKYLTVVSEVTNHNIEIDLQAAMEIDQTIEVDGLIKEPLPPMEFGRVAAQSARQVINQRVREAERAHQYAEFKDRVGQLVNGLIKRIEFGHVIMELSRADAILRREECIPRETFRVGDRLRTYIMDVRPDSKGPMIFLSRTHPKFMAKLFEQEVPEIYDGIVEIKAVARDPGSRAKIGVFSPDPSVDPVGACVGMRGSRVQAVVNELQGEKVDIIPWSANPATFVVNALAPAEVIKVVIDEDMQRVDVVVADDQLSLAIGRRGQNVRLASQLSGWRIDIMTEAQEAAKRTEEYALKTELFMKALDVDEIIAQLLAAEGFASLEDIVEAPMGELLKIEGFDEEIAGEIKERANTFILNHAEIIRAHCKEQGMTDDLIDFEGLTMPALELLLKNDIKTLDDFAGLSGEELLEIIGGQPFSIEQANAFIMKARAHWFAEDERYEDGGSRGSS